MNELAVSPLGHWLGFLILCLFAMGRDLGVGQRRAHAPSMREAAGWSALWIAVALLFNAWLWHIDGKEKALEFFTGYLIEKALSVDNLFVFIMLFAYFGVAPDQQPRVLKWGIIGAIIMRGIFIAVGAALLARFSWVIYLFGAFLVWTGLRMVLHREGEVHPERNIFVRLSRRFLPVSTAYDGAKFTTRVNGTFMFTPLFIVLLVVESTDVIFAIDSIPAIFGITSDPFIVFTSNMFAIMGLRALYFLLAGALHLFRYLKAGVALVLVVVGVKMCLAGVYHVPVEASLGIVALLLGGAVALSLLHPAPRAD